MFPSSFDPFMQEDDAGTLGAPQTMFPSSFDPFMQEDEAAKEKKKRLALETEMRKMKQQLSDVGDERKMLLTHLNLESIAKNQEEEKRLALETEMRKMKQQLFDVEDERQMLLTQLDLENTAKNQEEEKRLALETEMRKTKQQLSDVEDERQTLRTQLDLENIAKKEEEEKRTIAEIKLRDAEQGLVHLENASHQQRMQLAKADLSVQFYKAITNTYSGIYFEVEQFDVLPQHPDSQAVLDAFAATDGVTSCAPQHKNPRYVFHSAPAQVIDLIVQNGLRPSQCRICRGQEVGGACEDPGWFGDHTKGVYVSKHPDYTTFYANDREPRVGDTGVIIMLKTILGPVKYMANPEDGAPPDACFSCHESTNHLEYYMYDADTMAGMPCKRCMPVAVIRWKAVKSRGGIHHDGA